MPGNGAICGMTITTALIKATAEKYTVAELKGKISALLGDVEANGSVITSASTGAGASYSRMTEASRLELIELYQAAIDYKEGRPNSTGGVHGVAFVSPFNR